MKKIIIVLSLLLAQNAMALQMGTYKANQGHVVYSITVSPTKIAWFISVLQTFPGIKQTPESYKIKTVGFTREGLEYGTLELVTPGTNIALGMKQYREASKENGSVIEIKLRSGEVLKFVRQ